jgi:predicted aspartyl protease/tetratricopeptide (TPR) repeat protein
VTAGHGLIERHFAGNFNRMNSLLRAAAPMLLALCAMLAHPARAEDAGKCKVVLYARLPVVMEGSRASVPVTVNGKETRLWLDSGAFYNFMSKAKAAELGLITEPLPPGFRVNGIGGSFTPELARVRDFGLGGGTLHNTEFIVGGSDAGNGFLGANLLGVVDTEFDLAKGKVNLFKETGCGKVSLAYWAAGMVVGEMRLLAGNNSNDHHIYGELQINGHTVRAMLDTGAETLLSRRAAERVGIDLNDPKVVGSMKMTGLGTQARQSWIARTKTISLGGEDISNSPIRVIDNGDDWSDHDMLLGMDFFLSHHVLVSQTQRKIYLTYNGGPIFSATTEREIGRMETLAQDMGSAQAEPEPKTADQFAGRGSARLSRNDLPGAIADLTEAIKLAPTRTNLLNDRANAYFRSGKPELGARDIETALAIAPDDHRLLVRRAQIRLGKGDRTGALADTEAAAAAIPKGSLDMMAVVGLYERLGKADRGLALLDPVIALHREDSTYPALLNARSWNRALANADLDRALRDINTALRKSGDLAGMLDTRALVDLRRKDYAVAVADAGAALGKAPKLASSLFVRGLARLASGDQTAGLADIAAARAIQPAIDQRFADYGLAAPQAATSLPARPQAPGGSDDADDQ